MMNSRCVFYLMAVLFVSGQLPLAVFSQNFVVNGMLEDGDREARINDSIVRRESLIIKDNRVYIQLVIDEGAKHIANHKRYKELSFLLPKEVVYDDASKRIYCYKDNRETEIGRMKSFLGFMPYIALADGVKIMSSPADAKLVISLNNDNQGISKSVIHSEESMEETLGKKCGQCHILEYIFSHKEWVEEDILHAFNRMQMETEERFTKDEQEIIDLFKKYQKGEIDKGRLAEFKSLKHIGEKDVANVAKNVYMNNCVPCHNPARIEDVSVVYSKRRCKSIIERIKEKEPSLFLQTDMDKLAGYLWEIKLRSCGN